MPKDSLGNFHMNPQRARAADRMNAGKAAAKPMGDKSMAKTMPDKESDGEKTSILQDHGDGTFTSKSHDGETMKHPHIGHAMVHMASKHSEGSHFHAHHDGMGGLTSHSHKGMGGGVEGPQEHDSTDDMASAMKDTMGDEPSQESDMDAQPMSFGV